MTNVGCPGSHQYLGGMTHACKKTFTLHCGLHNCSILVVTHNPENGRQTMLGYGISTQKVNS